MAIYIFLFLLVCVFYIFLSEHTLFGKKKNENYARECGAGGRMSFWGCVALEQKMVFPAARLLEPSVHGCHPPCPVLHRLPAPPGL